MEKIKELVRKNAELHGLILVELSIHGDSIEAVLYKMNGEISIYDLERITADLMRDLESLGVGRNYNVNLSSPGLDRVLKSKEELEIFKGRNVKYTFVKGERSYSETAILRGLQGEVVLFEGANGVVAVPFNDLQKVSLYEEDLFKRKGGKR